MHANELFQQLSRIPNKLVNRRFTSVGEKNLVLFKYSKRAFYDREWDKYPELREARGIVFDVDTGQICCRPFGRVDEITDLPNDAIYELKINGFMAAAWFFQGSWQVTTTGSFDSEYVSMAKEHLRFLENVPDYAKPYTLLFEICDPRDEHIIPEMPGAYLIGARHTETGEYMTPWELDDLLADIVQNISQFGYQGYVVSRPPWSKFNDTIVDEYQYTEGFMIRSPDGKDYIAKYKTLYYKDLKYLSRTKNPIVRDRLLNDESKFCLDSHPFELLDEKQRLYLLRDFYCDVQRHKIMSSISQEDIEWALKI